MRKRLFSVLAASVLSVSPTCLAQTDLPAGQDHTTRQHLPAHENAANGGHAEIPHVPTARSSGAIGGLRRAIPFEIGQRNVKSVMIDGNEVWIGSSGGAIRYDTHRGSYLTYDNKSGLLSNGVFHVSKSDGKIWIGTYGGGLSVFDPKRESWTNYNIPNGMGDAFVYDVLETPEGDVWIATWSGANRIRGGMLDNIDNWDLYTVDNTGGGLPNDWVYGLAQGKNGEVWMATEGGLARFEQGAWTNWKHADGLGAPLEIVGEDGSFGTDPGQFSSHHARQKEEQGLGDVKTAYNPNYIVAIDVAPDGAVWTGTWGAGLNRFDGNTWKTMTVADGLPGNHIFALHFDESGRLWIGTNRGLAIMDHERITKFGGESGLNVESIFAIDTSGDAAWVGGFGGATWFPYGLDTGTPSDAGGN